MNIGNRSEFTPLPWAIEENVQMKGFSHLAITNRNHPDWFVCSITPMNIARDRDYANAKLIVRAPVLLAEVERLRDVQAWVPTKEQLASLCNLILRYQRAPDSMTTHSVGMPGVIMVQFNELWIGIEPDGYAHT